MIPDSEAASCEVEADGLSSRDLSTPLAVRTADCLPVAVIGEKGLALLHVGHRGLRADIILHPRVRETAPRLFFVGPHIRREAFPVTEEFLGLFPDSPHFSFEGGKIFFSLAPELKDRILRAFPRADMADCGICSHKDTRFHSHRRDGTAQRNINILRRAGVDGSKWPC